MAGARAGDPNSLLRLYVLASGGARERAEYDGILARIDAFVAEVRPKLEAESDEWQKGNLLHREMHRTFLGFDEESGALKNYLFPQSRLTSIFTTGKFNCISSSLLFTVIARKFGYPVEGVIMASHAFVQVHLPGERVIEVETTLPRGYGLKHDREFYRIRGLQWFSSRGLPRSSFEDYEQRRIVPAWWLGIDNMNHQHTDPRRMGYLDRNRLTEIQALFDTSDTGIQSNLLAFYNDEFNTLYKLEKWKVLARMYHKVGVNLERVRRLHGGNPAIRDVLVWSDYQRAYSFLQSGEDSLGLVQLESLLESIPSDHKDADALRDNAMAALSVYVQSLVKKGEFKRAHWAVQQFLDRCRSDSQCKANLAWVYSSWGGHHFENRDWPAAIEAYSRFLDLGLEVEHGDTFRNNIESTYLNWAGEYEGRGNWPKVLEVLSACVRKLSESSRCETYRKEITERHQI